MTHASAALRPVFVLLLASSRSASPLRPPAPSIRRFASHSILRSSFCAVQQSRALLSAPRRAVLDEENAAVSARPSSLSSIEGPQGRESQQQAGGGTDARGDQTRPRPGKAPVLVLDDDTLETRPAHVALVVGLWAVSAAALQPVVAELAAPAAHGLWLAAVASASIVFSDFFSGLFHWVADNYGNGRTPVRPNPRKHEPVVMCFAL